MPEGLGSDCLEYPPGARDLGVGGGERVRVQTCSLWFCQVESSPQPNLPAGEQLEGPNQAQDSDPRSPTLGIARTPMKTSSGGKWWAQGILARLSPSIRGLGQRGHLLRAPSKRSLHPLALNQSHSSLNISSLTLISLFPIPHPPAHES